MSVVVLPGWSLAADTKQCV